MTPYDVPRAFATLLDGVPGRTGPAFDGLRFRSRSGTGATTRGVALFGDHGAQTAWTSAQVREVDEPLLDELRTLGVFVTDPPALAELHQAPDP